MLHLLIHTLRDYGFDAYFIPQNEPVVGNPRYNTPLYLQGITKGPQEISEEWVVVYPEGIHGNPLNAKHVVRYLLNYEAAFGGPGMGASDGDHLITYVRDFHPTAPVLFCPIFDSDLLIRAGKVDARKPRNTDAFYVGKGAVYGQCPRIKYAVEVTRNWPETKKELHDQLEKTAVFHSYDWITSTCLDAALLGCEVRLIGTYGGFDAGRLYRPDSILGGLWERSEEDGLPYMRANSSEKLLELIRKGKAEFAPTAVELFSRIAAM